MDLKTHRLRHPSQDSYGVQPSRQKNAGTQPRTGNSQKNEFSTTSVRAFERAPTRRPGTSRAAGNRPDPSRAASSLPRVITKQPGPPRSQRRTAHRLRQRHDGHPLRAPDGAEEPPLLRHRQRQSLGTARLRRLAALPAVHRPPRGIVDRHDHGDRLRIGEEEVVKRDPWELVTEAINRMKRNGDVMRADRLKQVMQQIDSSFDEKNLGMSKFSRFVTDAAHRGLLTLTKLENGQLEVGPPHAGGAPP